MFHLINKPHYRKIVTSPCSVELQGIFSTTAFVSLNASELKKDVVCNYSVDVENDVHSSPEEMAEDFTAEGASSSVPQWQKNLECGASQMNDIQPVHFDSIQLSLHQGLVKAGSIEISTNPYITSSYTNSSKFESKSLPAASATTQVTIRKCTTPATALSSRLDDTATIWNPVLVDMATTSSMMGAYAGTQDSELFANCNQARSETKSGSYTLQASVTVPNEVEKQEFFTACAKIRAYTFRPDFSKMTNSQSTARHTLSTAPTPLLTASGSLSQRCLDDKMHSYTSTQASVVPGRAFLLEGPPVSKRTSSIDNHRISTSSDATDFQFTNLTEDIGRGPTSELSSISGLSTGTFPCQDNACELNGRWETEVPDTSVPGDTSLNITQAHEAVKSTMQVSALIQPTNSLALATSRLGYRQTSNHPEVDQSDNPPTTLTESDDHFSLGASEEEELLQLTEVHEEFSVPLNAQVPFNRASQTEEEYNSIGYSSHEREQSPVASKISSEFFSLPESEAYLEQIDAHAPKPYPSCNQDQIDSATEDKDWLSLFDTVAAIIESRCPSPKLTETNTRQKHLIQDGSPSISVQTRNPSQPFNHPLYLPSSTISHIDNESGRLPPFARSPFPAATPDHPSIPGLSALTRLRTCFRVGEALREGSAAARNRQHVVIELYARVLRSSREEDVLRQTFRLGDLFHDRGPFLNGVCTNWKHSNIWDADTSTFLEEEKDRGASCKMARVVGKVEWNAVSSSWLMDVWSIWQCSWDDVAYVKGIVCS